MFKFVLGIFIFHGNYMFPAVRDGDLCITYRLERYIIGDVVLYNTDGKEKVGRIVAVEGQTVEVTDGGELLMDGVPPLRLNRFFILPIKELLITRVQR